MEKVNNKRNIRTLAFVLPQFHPTPENDQWWGKGFTEWTNVTKAKPLFNGHFQPNLPTDLGFYDLRLPQARRAQADLAKEYGIHGFCYYHYWFNGKRLLDEPIDGMLAQKDLNMPFMLCWANENWTRRWDGKDSDVLMHQDYSEQDDAEHIRWLCTHVFSDPRYITINKCPVFAVYDERHFPDLSATARVWRNIAKEEFGFDDLYLCLLESFNRTVNPVDFGFDAAIEFSPHKIIKHKIKKTRLQKWGLKKWFDLRDYKRGMMESVNRVLPDYKVYRSVTPSWDNTPRKGERGSIAIGDDPNVYEQWMRNLVESFEPYSEDENLFFINAMNEWAEGNHLEPCIKNGHSFLEATKRALS